MSESNIIKALKKARELEKEIGPISVYKCKKCNAVINPKWSKCLVCRTPLNLWLEGFFQHLNNTMSNT
jgi:hypothetical protein